MHHSDYSPGKAVFKTAHAYFITARLQKSVQRIFVILPLLIRMRNFLTGANEFNSCLAVDPRFGITITELLTAKRGVRNAS